MYEYKTVSLWCGWFGGWGSIADIDEMIDFYAGLGWRLCEVVESTKWWYYVVPRSRVLMIFERSRSYYDELDSRAGVPSYDRSWGMEVTAER